MIKNLAIISVVLLTGLQSVSAGKGYLLPLSLALDVNVNDSPGIKTVGIKISSKDDSRSILLDMAAASLPKDKRGRSTYVRYDFKPEDTYEKWTDKGLQQVKWENMLGKTFEFDPKEKLTIYFQQPLAFCASLEEGSDQLPNRAYDLYVKVMINNKEVYDGSFSFFHYNRFNRSSILPLKDRLTLSIEHGNVKSLHATKDDFKYDGEALSYKLKDLSSQSNEQKQKEDAKQAPDDSSEKMLLDFTEIAS